MNLLTETGEGLLMEGGVTLNPDGFPLDPVTRAQESFDVLMYLWDTRPVEGLTYTQGGLVLTVTQSPTPLVNAFDQAVGIEVVVSLTDNDVPVSIDGTRRILNPPLVNRAGITEVLDGEGNVIDRVLVQSVGAALFEAVLDSIAAVPQ